MAAPVEQVVKELCEKLANYHWSPMHPSNYVIPAGFRKVKGIGLIAKQDYGAFNLAWAASANKWKTEEDQGVLIQLFSMYQKHTHYLINNVPVGDWLCLLKPKGFSFLIENEASRPDHPNKVPPDVAKLLMETAEMALKIRAETT